MSDIETGNGQVATPTLEAENHLEMTREELERKIDTDPKFANDYLDGKIVIETVEHKAPEPEAKPVEIAPAPAEAPKSEAAPSTPASELAKPHIPIETDDGKFVVEFDDGRKLIYKSKPEALKAIREKENFIERQKTLIEELKSRDRELGEKIRLLESQKLKAEEKPVVAPQAQPAKSEEPLDPFDPDYHKKLQERVDERIRELENKQNEALSRFEKHQTELADREKARDDFDRQTKEVQARYAEVNLFLGKHPEFKLEKPVHIVDTEYKSFLGQLGEIAGTDGSVSQNVAVYELYLDAENDKGKALKVDAEKYGIRPPENLDDYFKVLNLLNTRSGLMKTDRATKKSVPFTLEETYNFIRATNPDFTAIQPAVVPASAEKTKEPEKALPSPMAQAIQAAKALSGTVASDLPAAKGTAPFDASTMTPEQQEAVFDWPLSVVKSDPAKRAIWEAVFRLNNVAPPRLE